MYIHFQIYCIRKIKNLISAVSTSEKKLVDSSNLKLEICNDCFIFFGGLFPVHAPKYIRDKLKTKNENSDFSIESSLNTSLKILVNSVNPIEMMCGEIKKERGIQRLEAMLYAIDLINNSTSLLPGLKLGAKIFDTCDRDTIALEKSIEFVSDHFLLNSEKIIDDFICETNNTILNYIPNQNKMKFFPKKLRENIQRRKVVGVIGAASSSVSVQVANLLRLFQVIIN
jgi:hypothetical protein